MSASPTTQISTEPDPWAELTEALTQPLPTAEDMRPPDLEPEPKPATPQQKKRPVSTPSTDAAGGAQSGRFPWTKKRYFGNPLDLLVPHAERIKIYKRTDDGKLKYIKDYSLQELARAQDIERFIQEYLVKKHGEGEYDVVLIDQKGQSTKEVPVFVSDPNPQPQGGFVMPPRDDRASDLLEKMLDQAQAKLDKLEAQMSSHKEPTVTDRLAEVQAMIKMFGGDGKPMDPMSMMLMMQMMQPKQDTSARTELSDFRSELRAIAQQVASASQIPLPIPSPPPDPTVGLGEIMQKVIDASKPQLGFAELLAIMKEQQPKTDTLATITGALPVIMGLFEKLSGKEEMREMKEELRSMRTQQGAATGGFKEVVENILALKRVAPDLMGGGMAPDLITAVIDRFTSPDFLDAAGKFVRTIKGGGSGEAPGQLGDGSSGDSEVEIEIPDEFDQYITKMTTAKTDDERINATMHGIRALAKLPAWQKHVVSVITAAKGGKKDEVMEFISNFFDGLTNAEPPRIAPQDAEKVVKSFGRQIERVMQFLAKFAG